MKKVLILKKHKHFIKDTLAKVDDATAAELIKKKVAKDPEVKQEEQEGGKPES